MNNLFNMSWRKIHISHEEIEKGEMIKIAKIFYDILDAYHELRHLNGIVIFEKIEDDEHYIYFSPASIKIPALADLIKIYSGLICKAPFKGSVNYLAGDVDFAKYFL
jgi:hypothetical protein